MLSHRGTSVLGTSWDMADTRALPSLSLGQLLGWGGGGGQAVFLCSSQGLTIIAWLSLLPLSLWLQLLKCFLGFVCGVSLPKSSTFQSLPPGLGRLLPFRDVHPIPVSQLQCRNSVGQKRTGHSREGAGLTFTGREEKADS